MARLPDGMIMYFESAELGTTVNISDTKELILCKNCKHCYTEDLQTYDRYGNPFELIKNWYFCDRNPDCLIIKPDGYCNFAELRGGN